LFGAAATAFVVSQMVRHLMESALEEAAQVLVTRRTRAAHAVTELSRCPPGHRETLVWQLRSSDGGLNAASHAPKEPGPRRWSRASAGDGLALFTLAERDLGCRWRSR
jgi:hypothetical protein